MVVNLNCSSGGPTENREAIGYWSDKQRNRWKIKAQALFAFLIPQICFRIYFLSHFLTTWKSSDSTQRIHCPAMLRRLHKALRSSQPLNVPSPKLSPSSPSQLHLPSLSRRQITVCSNSCLLLLLGAHALPLPPSSRAQESDRTPENSTLNANGCTERKPTKTVFFDISIDGEPAGRIIMGLYGDDVPNGVDRFSKIVSGAAGISYRRKEFIKIMPNYVQHGGLRSYGVDAELAKRTGSNLGTESLVQEWERTYEGCPGTKNMAGSVGIIVRDPSKPPPKLKLVAKKGKLEIGQEEVGVEPNGTEFVIATKDSPELDASTLVIGRVLEGMEVVTRIAQVKTVQENTASPYFR